MDLQEIRYSGIFAIILIYLAACAYPMDNKNSNQTNWIKVIDGLDFPEGPAWDGQETLYVSNCHGGWITKITSKGAEVFLRASESPFTFEKTNGLTVYKDGSLFACEFGKGLILKISADGKSEVVANGYRDKRFNKPNDLAFDPKGNLYFTDPYNYRRENPDGVVYRLNLDSGTVMPVAQNLGFPNGIAFSEDGQKVYICESAFQRVLIFDVNSDGTLSNKTVFVDLPGGDPDGIALDQEGKVYVAHFGGGAIFVVNPDGTIQEKIQTPGKKPSNLEFGDKEFKTLYLTEDETNAVYKIRVDVPGLPLFSSPLSK